MDATRSLDNFSRIANSVALASRDYGYSHVTCHRSAYSYVPRYLFICHETFTIHARVMTPRLDSPYVIRLDSLRHGDDGMTSHLLCLSLVLGYRLLSLSSRRFSLRPVLYSLFRLHSTYPTGRYSCLLLLRLLRLFVLVSHRLVYILGWRWDDPHLQSTLQPP